MLGLEPQSTLPIVMPLDIHDPSRRVYENVLEAMGNTPLIRLTKVTRGIRTPVYGKAEYLQPGGSVKDRIGLPIIEQAEESGRLQPGGTVVEATAGNTGTALAVAAAIKGYRCVFVMPDKMSLEKQRLLKAFGARLVITPTAVPPDHPDYYLNTAKRIAEETPNAIFANQFYNRTNPEAHYESTAPEIWEQTRGKVTHFVAGMGTGGTISGVGRYLKEQNPDVRIVGADPIGSILQEYLETGEIGEGKTYMVEGIGMDKIPATLDIEYVDEIRQVSDKRSFQTARRLTREEGLFVGGSTGTIVAVALELARELDDPDACVVAMLCDLGERYLSKLHSDEWMRENRMLEEEEVEVGYLLEQKARGDAPPLILIESDATVREALDLMEKYNVSQIPVMEDEEQKGSLSEGALLTRVLAEPDSLDQPLAAYLEEPFPAVEEGASMKAVVGHFTSGESALLVRRGGRYVGILTKFDVLHYLTNGGGGG
ncbi:MAG: pyridoxal-phosphate dependent enzyme [Gemmatimonadota bacterium]|nr:pyridoxal-phosphate dependent enzyme [Gemmatimonadota bacterium]